MNDPSFVLTAARRIFRLTGCLTIDTRSIDHAWEMIFILDRGDRCGRDLERRRRWLKKIFDRLSEIFAVAMTFELIAVTLIELDVCQLIVHAVFLTGLLPLRIETIAFDLRNQ